MFSVLIATRNTRYSQFFLRVRLTDVYLPPLNCRRLLKLLVEVFVVRFDGGHGVCRVESVINVGGVGEGGREDRGGKSSPS